MSATPTRRAALTTLGAAGLLALSPVGTANAATKLARRQFIDVHHHHVPPAYLAAAKEAATKLKIGLPPPMRDWTAEKSLAQMDEHGIAAAILVLAQSQGVWNHDDPAGMAALARACNEHGAKMARDYPGRFGFHAWLPMPDVDGCLKEIAYALDELKADGIGFFTSYGTKYPGDPTFAPVFEELDRRKAAVYFHPYAPQCCGGMIPGVNDNFIEYTQDTARAVMSLLFSGTFARRRNINWIFSHGGGPIPSLAGRVNTLAASRAANLDKVAPKGVIFELQQLYYETANAAYKPTMDALMDMAPLPHIMFGTDYPYVTVEDNTEGMARLRLSAVQRRAIESANATKLFPRFKSLARLPA